MSEQPKTRQKFRSSCTNCASAKVKCSTTRPNCARCVERGLECLYAPSNRYGRPPASVGTQKATLLRSPQADGCDLTMSDYASDGATWDFNSWVPASACNLTARNVHCEIDAFSAAAYYEEWNLEDIPQLVAASSHGSSSTNTNSPKNSSSGASDSSQEAAHSCLAQAAAILVDIRNDSSSTDLTWAATNVDAKTIVGDVIFANRRATGQVSRIMECACLAADYQISVIVSLICFHMIDRYGKAVAAARATLGSTLGNNHVIGSVQILLDELRRITPLIGKSTMQAGEPPGSAGTMGIPVSGFGQLHRDLEHHLFNVLGEAESFLHQASE
ncbi:uncharacterized protein TRIVIDRAFT_62548 [Trichoderma virens Gv29-8]|uniref:Zn(2)-C6 fungal-type domain-containing protein n=1 Tax=Hypocrea virens (strain Gv29-8 / FGSC 10586) TaxID=413071 RepID=G9MFI1_HYPVG|nr:uncharacterized protein TRIVIDRAFT_62548 [Trichoderma virens Gv29-8]EHK26733.1 hypothetical protein TRIVIDRAFT_62548 [Trichoderma virens Gv29-8]